MSLDLSAWFDELREGEEFTTPGRTICEADLVGFSALTGDWHPQHADAEWAAAGPFGERIAHGMLLLSYSLGLAPIDPERVVALRGLDSVRFKRPVRIGETIRVQGAVASLRPLDEASGLVGLDWRLLGAGGRTAVRAELQAIWRRRAEAAADSNGSTTPAAEARDAAAADGSGVPAPAARWGGESELSPLQRGRVLI